jgi:hypothetical protein
VRYHLNEAMSDRVALSSLCVDMLDEAGTMDETHIVPHPTMSCIRVHFFYP